MYNKLIPSLKFFVLKSTLYDQSTLSELINKVKTDQLPQGILKNLDLSDLYRFALKRNLFAKQKLAQYIRERLQTTKELNWQGSFLAGLDLSGLDLRQHDIRSSNLTDVNLEGTQLNMCSLFGCVVNEKTLQSLMPKIASNQISLDGVNVVGELDRDFFLKLRPYVIDNKARLPLLGCGFVPEALGNLLQKDVKSDSGREGIRLIGDWTKHFELFVRLFSFHFFKSFNQHMFCGFNFTPESLKTLRSHLLDIEKSRGFCFSYVTFLGDVGQDLKEILLLAKQINSSQNNDTLHNISVNKVAAVSMLNSILKNPQKYCVTVYLLYDCDDLDLSEVALIPHDNYNNIVYLPNHRWCALTRRTFVSILPQLGKRLPSVTLTGDLSGLNFKDIVYRKQEEQKGGRDVINLIKASMDVETFNSFKCHELKRQQMLMQHLRNTPDERLTIINVDEQKLDLNVNVVNPNDLWLASTDMIGEELLSNEIQKVFRHFTPPVLIKGSDGIYIYYKKNGKDSDCAKLDINLYSSISFPDRSLISQKQWFFREDSRHAYLEVDKKACFNIGEKRFVIDTGIKLVDLNLTAGACKDIVSKTGRMRLNPKMLNFIPKASWEKKKKLADEEIGSSSVKKAKLMSNEKEADVKMQEAKEQCDPSPISEGIPIAEKIPSFKPGM